MNTAIAFEKCRSFIDCQSQVRTTAGVATHPLQHPPAVTISRETGSGAYTVAGLLAERLQTMTGGGHCHWTVFDHNLVAKVIEDHKLPKQVAQFMSEQHRSFVQDVMEELVGLHPDSWTLAHQTTETILHLAQMGNVVLVGRGANVITAKMPSVFHVRLIAPLEKRIAHIQEFFRCEAKEAAEFVRKGDRGRALYIREHFHCDVEDPLQYHLVINTGMVPYAETAQIIAQAALRHFEMHSAVGRA